MNGLEFTASLVHSLAWPAAVAFVAFGLRHQIRGWMAERPSRFKAGPLEAEWDSAERRVPPPIRLQQPLRLVDTATKATAHDSPRSAILERYDEVIRLLAREVKDRLGEQVGLQSMHPPGVLIDTAEDAGIIDAATRQALIGLTVMRNVAAHGSPEDIDEAKAAEFRANADSTEYAMRYRFSLGPAREDVDGVRRRPRDDHYRESVADAYVKLIRMVEAAGTWAQMVKPMLDTDPPRPVPPLPTLTEQVEVGAALNTFGSDEVRELFEAWQSIVRKMITQVEMIERDSDVGQPWKTLHDMRPRELEARKALAHQVNLELRGSGD